MAVLDENPYAPPKVYEPFPKPEADTRRLPMLTAVLVVLSLVFVLMALFLSALKSGQRPRQPVAPPSAEQEDSVNSLNDEPTE